METIELYILLPKLEMETITDNPPSPSMDFSDQNFRCPISTDLMKDPVTICTGVTYERKNIEKWLYLYKKNTCPATMQFIDSLEITPNHTLKRLIESWQMAKTHQPSISSPKKVPRKDDDDDDLVLLLKTIESTPFKVSSLKKLRSLIETRDDLKDEFKNSDGIIVMVKIIVHILVEVSDFMALRACEEALGILNQLPLCDIGTVELLVKPECIKSYALILQRGSGEARFYAVSLFIKLAKMNHDWINHVINDEGIDFFKSLLEIVSDEMFAKSSSCALQVLLDLLEYSKKSRLKAIESGAVCTLIELLPDSNRSKCVKIMHIIKILCECADGRLAFVEHGLGIAAVSKKILRFSNVETKIGVKILSLIGNSHPTENVLEEMLMSGSVKKLVAILNIGGESSTRKRAIKMLRLHAIFWKRYPCFPRELCDYLGIGNKF